MNRIDTERSMLSLNGMQDRGTRAFLSDAWAIGLFAALSMRVPYAAATTNIDWYTSPLDLDLRGMNGKFYVFHCPSGKPSAAHVSGSGPYTDASSICAAAVHAGALRARDGGDVTIVIRPGQAHYRSSQRNTLQSSDYDGYWSGSFDVVQSKPSSPSNEEPR